MLPLLPDTVLSCAITHSMITTKKVLQKHFKHCFLLFHNIFSVNTHRDYMNVELLLLLAHQHVTCLSIYWFRQCHVSRLQTSTFDQSDMRIVGAYIIFFMDMSLTILNVFLYIFLNATTDVHLHNQTYRIWYIALHHSNENQLNLSRFHSR